MKPSGSVMRCSSRRVQRIVMSLIQTGKIEAIVGVSCLSVLERAFPYMEAAAIPGVAVPLLQDDCIDTTVDLDWVWDYIHLTSDDKTRRLDLGALRDEVDSWFSTAVACSNHGQLSAARPNRSHANGSSGPANAGGRSLRWRLSRLCAILPRRRCRRTSAKSPSPSSAFTRLHWSTTTSRTTTRSATAEKTFHEELWRACRAECRRPAHRRRLSFACGIRGDTGSRKPR